MIDPSRAHQIQSMLQAPHSRYAWSLQRAIDKKYNDGELALVAWSLQSPPRQVQSPPECSHSAVILQSDVTLQSFCSYSATIRQSVCNLFEVYVRATISSLKDTVTIKMQAAHPGNLWNVTSMEFLTFLLASDGYIAQMVRWCLRTLWCCLVFVVGFFSRAGVRGHVPYLSSCAFLGAGARWKESIPFD